MAWGELEGGVGVMASNDNEMFGWQLVITRTDMTLWEITADGEDDTCILYVL